MYQRKINQFNSKFILKTWPYKSYVIYKSCVPTWPCRYVPKKSYDPHKSYLLPPANESLRRLCFYTCLSFCPQGGACVVGGHVWQGVCLAGGVCDGGHAWQGRHAWQGGMHGRGRAWQGACMAGGHAWQGGMHGRGGMHGGGPCMPPRHHEIRSVDARAVRILLECILVLKTYCICPNFAIQIMCPKQVICPIQIICPNLATQIICHMHDETGALSMKDTSCYFMCLSNQSGIDWNKEEYVSYYMQH